MYRKLQNQELNRLSPEEYKQAPKLPVVIILDNIRSQNNVGSVFRTSDAFRVEKSIFAESPPHLKTGRYTKRPSEQKT